MRSEFLGVPVPRRPTMTSVTGVILGIEVSLTFEQYEAMRAELEERFPGVTFAIVPGADSVSFSYEPPAAPQGTCW